MDLSVVLLHDHMVDKHNKPITASLTMIDVHDLARSCATYGVTNLFISHPAPTLRKLARALKEHWEEGFGATYNPNRREALEHVQIVSDLDEAIQRIDERAGKLPKLVATSARDGGKRITFSDFRPQLIQGDDPYLLMLGTGWGMSDGLLARADYFLEPIKGPTPYNHLSVRSACAIMLDRILGR
ncbi:MAG: RNA methyltransferase [Oligoflexia bacterium]|nr:RNA methyltransferase [Oligoflexia bacterium]